VWIRTKSVLNEFSFTEEVDDKPECHIETMHHMMQEGSQWEFQGD
jgi:hypothetical protein